MQLKELLSILPFYETTKPIDNVQINGLKMDHREVNDGDVFICIRGFTVDGHSFAEKAIQHGATVIVSEYDLKLDSCINIIVSNTSRALAFLAAKFYDFPTRDLPLIGITGTNGKTTITYLIEQIMQKHYYKTGLIGTIQLKIGNKAKEIKNTTPDALFLQKTFRQMVDADVDIGIMEVSSHALHLGRVHGVSFDRAIFTNLSQDHLDFHETMDNYLQAKTLLFSQLGNDLHSGKKCAIVNIDDESSQAIIQSTAQPVLTFSCKKGADVYEIGRAHV